MFRSDHFPDVQGASDAERADLEHIWNQLGEPPPVTTPAETEDAWDRLSKRLHLDSRASARRPPDRLPARRSRLRLWTSVGTVALGALAFALWAAPSLTAPVTVSAAPGETRAVTLPDGSTASLAAGSQVTYRKRFGSLVGLAEVRRVALVGEGLFDVEHGEAPFVVETFNARVEVLGTRFAVRAHSDEEQTRVVVQEGSVRVESAGESVRLAAGEATVVSGASAPPSAPASADASRAAAWAGGGLAFDALPLADAFREIERRYGVTVRVRGAAAARADSPGADVTAFYARAPDVRTVLGDLCAANGLRFEATSQGFEVFADHSPAPRPGPTATMP